MNLREFQVWDLKGIRCYMISLNIQQKQNSLIILSLVLTKRVIFFLVDNFTSNNYVFELYIKHIIILKCIHVRTIDLQNKQKADLLLLTEWTDEVTICSESAEASPAPLSC